MKSIREQQLEISNIKAIFLFQDVLSDAYLNNKTILEMKKYIIDLTTKGIYVYPPPEVIDNFGSKKYNLICKCSACGSINKLKNSNKITEKCIDTIIKYLIRENNWINTNGTMVQQDFII